MGSDHPYGKGGGGGVKGKGGEGKGGGGKGKGKVGAGRGGRGPRPGLTWRNPAVTAVAGAAGWTASATSTTEAPRSPKGPPDSNPSQGGGWRGAPLIPLGMAAAGVRTILMVVLQTTPPLLLTAPRGDVDLGAVVESAHRPSAVVAARGWLENITRGRLQGTPECFLAGTLRTEELEDQIVVCPLSSVPAGLPDTVVTSTSNLPRQVRRQEMAWVALPALAPTPLYSHAGTPL